MDASSVLDLILGPLGVLVVLLLFGYLLISGSLRFARDVESKDVEIGEQRREIEALKTENKVLWKEKVDDAKESARIADAYVELREREMGERKYHG